MNKNCKIAGFFILVIFAVLLPFSACDNPLMEKLLQPITITFDSNGGSFVKPQTVIKNKRITEPKAPTKDNYFFGGWYTDNEFFETRWNFDDIPEGDMTLYADWNSTRTPERRNFEFVGENFYHDGEKGGFDAAVIYDGDPKIVTVIPKLEISVGEITVYYNGGINPPTDVGEYKVTFDVAAGQGWSAVKGLTAGTLTITAQTVNPVNPAAADFDISGLSQAYDGYAKAVSITPKPGKSQGDITIYYEGIEDTSYTKKTDAPSDFGEYKVTFDVAAVRGWNEAKGLTAGTLTIAIHEVSNLGSYLRGLSENPPDEPYYIPLNVGNINNIVSFFSILKSTIDTYGRYVILDLSGNAITSIPNNAFCTLEDDSISPCYSLTGIIIPNSVTSIGADAFRGCENLAEVTIGNSVKIIGDDAFRGCKALTNLTIGEKVESIGYEAFALCTSLTSVIIPNSVTSIGSSAFSGCNSLKEVTIGEKVESIGQSAFAYCTSLTQVTFEGTILKESFNPSSFPGDLQQKYLDPNNGGPGTYIKEADGTTDSWKKQ